MTGEGELAEQQTSSRGEQCGSRDEKTRIRYAPSTKFYLADKLAGKPWVTRLPFPVHVVERVETLDRISGNRCAYHHGCFGMVEQRDTEATARCPTPTNIDGASHVPPVLTRTWFHTDAFLDEAVSRSDSSTNIIARATPANR
jgi:hypothetical protein